MSRWNISQVVYYSQHGQNRILDFEPRKVTIITGASRTGKSYIIETIDYCLCSSSINLSTPIKKKVSYVGIKLVKDNTEILIAREISQKTSSSSKMYIEIGNKVSIPSSADGLKGNISESEARILLATRFGLIDFKSYEKEISTDVPNISIRQLMPYIFLDKEVIDSKKIILHGLDDPNASKHIIASLPYFLNAIDIEELEALRKQKGLKKGIEAEEKKKLAYEQRKIDSLEKTNLLLSEAIQVGLLKELSSDNEPSHIIAQLREIVNWQPSRIIFENENLLNELQKKKSSILFEVNNLKRKRVAAIKNNSINSDFKTVTEKQAAKLDLDKIFNLDDGNCPICNSHLEQSSRAAELIKESFEILKVESKVIDDYQPKLDKYIIELDKTINANIALASSVEVEIQNLIKESEVAKNQKDENNIRLRAIGRISYFLDDINELEEFNVSKLDQYTREYDDINKKYGVSQRKEKIREAERLISNIATKNLSVLPIDELYKDNNIDFNANKPTIKLSNNKTLAVEEFEAIGSDENYLSIHLAFLFALHKFFEAKERPVPGFLIIDQVSRPYYPKDIQDKDIIIDEDIIDEDREALEKHFNFIFDQVENQKGLQVIILEHAYFQKNERYKTATKYRWPRNGTDRLIPQDWPDKE